MPLSRRRRQRHDGRMRIASLLLSLLPAIPAAAASAQPVQSVVPATGLPRCWPPLLAALSRPLALMGFLALPGCAAAVADPVPVASSAAAGAPIVIHDNRGGNVLRMMARRAELERSGREVRITGVCRSACTMLVTLPNACLHPEASVGFHAPRLPGTTIIPPMVDQMMAAHYRNGIRERWFAEWRHSLDIHSISAREYVQLDPQTRLCAE